MNQRHDPIGKAQGQRLDGDNLQDVLDAGANAWRVGRQQFFTPRPLARDLMLPLPSCRASFVDFNMGGGDLLMAAITPSTANVYGIDIDSRLARKPNVRENVRPEQDGGRRVPKDLTHWNTVCADITKFYPLLQEVGWQFDLCGLNPPFSIKWKRSNLVGLVDSECEAVRETFGRVARASGLQESKRDACSTIDSVLASYLIALDRMSARGEGFLLCSEASARKIAETPAGKHIWFWLTITQPSHEATAGNANEDGQDGNCVFGRNVRPFDVAVLYFARAHVSQAGERINNRDGSYWNATEGNTARHETATMSTVRSVLSNTAADRRLIRKGLSIYNTHDFVPTTHDTWRAAKEEWLRLKHVEEGGRPDYNIWLRKDGTIGRHLTPFQNWSGRIPRDAAERLNKLAGQQPMALVVQKATRLDLLEAIGCGTAQAVTGNADATSRCCPWRVDPDLAAAVTKAIGEYHAQRAPFYPLNEVQRLGYLDEEDMITCKRDLGATTDYTNGTDRQAKANAQRPTPNAQRPIESVLSAKSVVPCFLKGKKYSLSSETVDIEHHDEKLNLLGEPEEITLHGQELAFYIVDEAGDKHTFCGVPPSQQVLRRAGPRRSAITVTANGESTGYHHDLHTLIRHFVIPEVADVAQIDPDRYNGFVNQIRQIENRINQNHGLHG